MHLFDRVPIRRISIVLILAVLGAGLTVPTAGAAPPEVEDPMRAYSIVPPGQEGDVTAEELAAEDYGPNYSDQLEMYASLIDDDDVTDAELPTYFHSMQFGVEGEIAREYEPTEGVTVYRDSFGIPHIYADTMNNASFALGYVTAEDRMWQMDVLRHAGRGTLSEFVGEDYLPMDIDTRREGYTEEEVQKMFDRFDDKFGADGVAVQEGLQAYADGVNAHIAELKSDRADEMPAEYAATGNPPPVFPEEWTPTDTLFLVVLQLREFGETAGGELENAALFAHLKKKLGKKKGPKAFEDFMRQSDPNTYTSISPKERVFRSQFLGKTNMKSVAIPDHAAAMAAKVAREERTVDRLAASLGFKTPASNALLVSAKESESGNPLEIGAPQVGYANPAFFLDLDVHVPGVADFRGPAVPGASALIPLGRGADYAWTLTTGFSDAVDVRAERLCDPEGGQAQLDSNGYVFRGKCREMKSREETFIVKPQPTDPGPPAMETRTFYRTKHGPVFRRATVKGKPVAFVKERFFWKKELDSVVPFYKWNTEVDSLGDFKAAAKNFTMSFNAFYADKKRTAYFHVGHYPIRKRGVHPALPVWGTGKWEWQGRFPFRKHPQTIDPEQGWVANWNNRPAAGWNNYDGAKWGSIHRVQLLANKMSKLLKGSGKAELSDLVDVIRVAATQDARGVFLGKKMISLARKTAGLGEAEQAALKLVNNWIKAGSHRINKDRDDFLDDSAGIAIFDLWYDKLVDAVFQDELGADGGRVPAPVFDHDMWFDFSSYLKNVFGKKTRKKYVRNYCDKLGTKQKETCAQAAFSSLNAALTQLRTDQGDDMAQWKAAAEWIEFENHGAGSVPHIPWQNRGVHNHVVEILDAPPTE